MITFAFWLGVITFGVCAWLAVVAIGLYLVRLFGEDDQIGDGENQ